MLRSVLFVDFDNVFFSLQSADKDAAKFFANDPQSWLDAIESGSLIDEGPGSPGPQRRRILMRRCYANPAVMRFFRGWFTRSGFQIVDCPPLTGKGKNSADIYMVVDMLDAMRHETRFDEFIILSGDADFTPVLTRLRAFDRRSVIYSNAVTAAAYKSLCDGMITEERLIDLTVGGEEEESAIVGRIERRAEPREPRSIPAPTNVSLTPLPAPPSAQLGSDARPNEHRGNGDAWGNGDQKGTGEARNGPRRRMPQRTLGPADDMTTSEGAAVGARLPRLPDEIEALVRRVAAATNVPPFAPEVYGAIFRALSAEVLDRGFSLNRTVNGVIRRIAADGLRIRPQSVAFVIKGLMLSGHEFGPDDSPGSLAKSFRRQVLYLASNADLALADAERSAVGAWIVGALRSVPPSEALSSDEVPSDAVLAAEVAGLTIEDTLHPIDDGPSSALLPLNEAEYRAPQDHDDEVEDEIDRADDGVSEETPARSIEPVREDARPIPNIDDLLARIRRPRRG